jgi:hypothetical protein
MTQGIIGTMTPEERDRLVKLETNQEHLEELVKEIHTDVKDIRTMTNRWRGASAVLLGLGGAIGFISGWLKDWVFQ